MTARISMEKIEEDTRLLGEASLHVRLYVPFAPAELQLSVVQHDNDSMYKISPVKIEVNPHVQVDAHAYLGYESWNYLKIFLKIG